MIARLRWYMALAALKRRLRRHGRQPWRHWCHWRCRVTGNYHPRDLDDLLAELHS